LTRKNKILTSPDVWAVLTSKGLMPFRQSLLFYSTLKKTKGSSIQNERTTSKHSSQFLVRIPEKIP